jgi:hypothetical protein
MYPSKLAAQVVTLTPPEHFVGEPYIIKNQNFDFGTTQTLILNARSIFLRGGSLKKYVVKNCITLIIINTGHFFCSVPVENMKTYHSYIHHHHPPHRVELDLSFADRDDAQICKNFLLERCQIIHMLCHPYSYLSHGSVLGPNSAMKTCIYTYVMKLLQVNIVCSIQPAGLQPCVLLMNRFSIITLCIPYLLSCKKENTMTEPAAGGRGL